MNDAAIADIISTILNTARGVRKSKIMYDTRLANNQLCAYLQLLTDTGLLEYLADNEEYRTTKQGERFLAIYTKTNILMNPKDTSSPNSAS